MVLNLRTKQINNEGKIQKTPMSELVVEQTEKMLDDEEVPVEFFLETQIIYKTQ